MLAGLREHMLDPEFIETSIREYRDGYARRAAATRPDAAKLVGREAEADFRVRRPVEAIANGRRRIDEIMQMLAEAKVEQAAVRAALAEQEALPVVAPHPTVAADYRNRSNT